MMKHRLLFFMYVLFMAMAMASCRHSPLYDLSNAHYLRIYVCDSIQNINTGLYDKNAKQKILHLPQVLRVVLSDKTTGQVVYERYLQHSGRDAHGYYLDGYIGAPEGNYRLMAYNFGTETTQIRNEYSYFDMTGYTPHISPMYYPLLPQLKAHDSYDEQNILYDPDHLWVVADDDVAISDQMGIDTLYAADKSYYRAESIVETYYIQVRVRGVQWVRSSVSLLTGMANAKLMHNGKMIGEPPATVYFEMQQRETKTVSKPDNSETLAAGKVVEPEEAVMYATFNTWGKMSDIASLFHITFSFVKSDGSNQSETMDITQLFAEEDVRRHRWILIDKVIEIKKPEGGESGGGFTPEVEDWDKIDTDVIL